MKKPIAYILFVLDIVIPVCSDIFITHKFDEQKISHEMYQSSKGLKVIISYIEIRLAKNNLESFIRWVSVILLGTGVVIILFEKICDLQTKINNCEHQLDYKT